MKPEIKTKWVAALRSGKYIQTKNYLKFNDGYCCLGVLCEISKLETGYGIDENGINGNKTISNTIREWSGLEYKNGGSVYIGDECKSLAGHNDDGRTFLEIADAIESQL